MDDRLVGGLLGPLNSLARKASPVANSRASGAPYGGLLTGYAMPGTETLQQPKAGNFLALGDQQHMAQSLPQMTGQIVGRLSNGRPIVKNVDGSFSTQRLVTINDERLHGGKAVNIPTIYGGKEVSIDEAIEIIVRNRGIDPETGSLVRAFPSIDDAVSAARLESKEIEQELLKY